MPSSVQTVDNIFLFPPQASGLLVVLPPFPTREDVKKVFPPKVTQRLSAAGWLRKVDMGCRETRYTLESLLESVRRINSGELPPRLPSEKTPKGTRKTPVRGNVVKAA